MLEKKRCLVREVANEVGYSDEIIEYGNNDIIVSFNRYGKSKII